MTSQGPTSEQPQSAGLLERLALSPQCGFATSILGNALSVDDERRKLDLICEVARRVWP